jgi:hypothetical protein
MVQELIDADAPPPLKRKASTLQAVREDKTLPYSHLRFASATSGLPSPLATSGTSARCGTGSALGGNPVNSDSGNECNDRAVQPKITGPERRKQRKREDRAKKRKATGAAEIGANTRQPRKKDVDSRVSERNATAVQTSINIHELPADSSGYAATYANAADDKVLNKGELESEGYTTVEWDGRYVPLHLVELALTLLHSGSHFSFRSRKTRNWWPLLWVCQTTKATPWLAEPFTSCSYGLGKRMSGRGSM